MIKKIKSINGMAVFHGFGWDNSVKDSSGKVVNFSDINVLYGRNYSGKTTLSRILRGLETGTISDKYGSPEFCLEFCDGSEITQDSLNKCLSKVRVFNEDFVRDNLRFITNPDENIEPFAILGEDNTKIEAEIQSIESELGVEADGVETCLFLQRKRAKTDWEASQKRLREAKADIESKLNAKATDKQIGIKYKPERFGDQNYNRPKLCTDIQEVQSSKFRSMSNEDQLRLEKLIQETGMQPVGLRVSFALRFKQFAEKTKYVLEKEISPSNKIEELVKNAILNRWVNEGRVLHVDRKTCAFCGSTIRANRWEDLEKHFDEESQRLESEIDGLIGDIGREKELILRQSGINKSLFYSRFHPKLDDFVARYKECSQRYANSLDLLKNQINQRKVDILNIKAFIQQPDFSLDISEILNEYDAIVKESNAFTEKLEDEKKKARTSLRLQEVCSFIFEIGYADLNIRIATLENEEQLTKSKYNQQAQVIVEKQVQIKELRERLRDEGKGAKKVNEYLNDFFGDQYLSLEPRQQGSGTGNPLTKFEVVRSGKKAYNLSEGECSLLAFCYFLAKLEDIDTKGSKPIVWIDDPISSLDSNHVFFVYSLIRADIVSKKAFDQLFISTHSLEFLKYLKRLHGSYTNANQKQQEFSKAFFIVHRHHQTATIKLMPRYLQEYVTEFNYLFHQIYQCAQIEEIDDSNYTVFYNFGNNARKFLEMYLYYKYPDGMKDTNDIRKFGLFFGVNAIPGLLITRVNNEYSHMCSAFERGATPIEVPEMKTVATLILNKIKASDPEQYSALLGSIGVV